MGVELLSYDETPEGDRLDQCYLRISMAGKQLEQGDLESSLELFQQAYRFNPDTTFQNLGDWVMEFGGREDYQSSKVLLEKLLDLDPLADGNCSWYMSLAGLYVRTGEDEKVGPIFDRGIAMGLDPIKLMEKKANLLVQIDDYEGALDTFERLYKANGSPVYALQIIPLAKTLGEVAKQVLYTTIVKADTAFLKDLFTFNTGEKADELRKLLEIDE